MVDARADETDAHLDRGEAHGTCSYRAGALPCSFVCNRTRVLAGQLFKMAKREKEG
jgi:hypothetical protein